MTHPSRTLTQLLLLAFLLCVGIPLAAAPTAEPTAIEKPDAAQARVIESLNQEIADEIKQIPAYFNVLKARNRVDKNNRTLVPMQADTETSFTQKTRFTFDRDALIQWNGEKIASISFDSRRGDINKVYVQKENLHVVLNENGQPSQISLFVYEVEDSGNAPVAIFRIPKEDSILDSAEEIDFNGRKERVKLVYVRKVHNRIHMLTQFRDALKLLVRRLDWFVRSVQEKNETQLHYLFRK